MIELEFLTSVKVGPTSYHAATVHECSDGSKVTHGPDRAGFDARTAEILISKGYAKPTGRILASVEGREPGDTEGIGRQDVRIADSLAMLAEIAELQAENARLLEQINES